MKAPMTNRKKHPVLKVLKIVIRLLYHRHTIIGTENVSKNSATVFICNHVESYSPIVMELFFPFEFRPWVLSNTCCREQCRDYIEIDFVKKELKLQPPFSRWLASVIAPLCIMLMKSVEAIPVFKGKIRIMETFNLSLEAIRQGNNLAIFPENAEEKYSEFLNDFNWGFVRLADLYRKDTGKTLNFYPVFIDKKNRTITIGKSVVFPPNSSSSKERKLKALYLRDSINGIATLSNIKIQ